MVAVTGDCVGNEKSVERAVVGAWRNMADEARWQHTHHLQYFPLVSYRTSSIEVYTTLLRDVRLGVLYVGNSSFELFAAIITCLRVAQEGITNVCGTIL